MALRIAQAAPRTVLDGGMSAGATAAPAGTARLAAQPAPALEAQHLRGRNKGPATLLCPAPVVYVHGLWLTGGESRVLHRRLERQFGFRVHRFRYSTVSESMKEIVRNLHRFVGELDAPCVHLVGHSLGGLVIYRYLQRYPRQPSGRVVFLGTPCKPSRAALQATHSRLVTSLMGRSAADELVRSQERRWTLQRDLGIIAGTQAVGVGRFLARFKEACDGCVAVSETHLPGATDHIALPVSHLGMLLSRHVARQTGLFLRDGRFSEPATGHRAAFRL